MVIPDVNAIRRVGKRVENKLINLNMHQTNLLDETLDRNQTHHYNVFMQFCADGISFCLFDTVKSKFIAFRHYPAVKTIKPEEVTCIIAADDLLKLPYKSASLLLNDRCSTLVPSSYFEEKAARSLYSFTFGHDNSPVLHNFLSDIQAENVFPYDPVYLSRFREYFTDLKVFHRTTPFLTNLMQESSKSTRKRVFISVEKELADIGIAQSKKLEFFNSFPYKETTDLLYYVMSVLEKFSLSPLNTEVSISVDPDRHEEVIQYLNIYLAQLKVIKPAERYTYSYAFDEFRISGFSNLFNLSLCV